jgi:predicted AlkP superfamily phosphohydrolase/phosphomutase
VVASDHGFTTLEYEFHANEWLRRSGWLAFDGDDPAALEDIADETRAYSLIPGRFYLHLEGREPRGPGPSEAYEETRDELARSLTDLEGPDGRPVIDRVIRREDAFFGDHDDIAPDLVAIPNPGFDLKAGFKGHDEVFDRGPRNGMHTFDDACLVADTPDMTVENVDLLDLAPTILEAMEIDYDAGAFDGRSLV